jgi:hypothetical protein
MVSISLFVELLRTRPLTLFWTMVAAQLVLWTLVPTFFFSTPPGQLPITLAIGHEFQLGTEFGPPLAFWLAEIAYRAAGMFGVYLLSQVCIVVTYWAVLALGRTIVGEVHAVMAVLLMAGIAAFSLPTAEFGPNILAVPLWALMLLHYWRAALQDRWFYWTALGFEAGLLLLTAYAGLILIALLLLYSVSTTFGRAQFSSVGPWIAGMMAVVVLFPYLIWLDLSGEVPLPNFTAVVANLCAWGWLVAALVAGHAGMAILIVLARGYGFRSTGQPPEIVRAPVARAARGFVYHFALAPIIAMGLFAPFAHRPENFVSAPLVVLSGLAVVVAAGQRIKIERQYLIGGAWALLLTLPPVLLALAVMIQPWTLALDLQVGQPAAAMGHFFAENFRRRTASPLEIVAGDPALASLVSLTAPSRPSLFLESAPKYRLRVNRQDLEEKGAVVLWPDTDTTGRPPPEIRRQFPDLVAEVPQTFERRFQGLMPLARMGWGVIRPRERIPPAAPPPPKPVPQAQPSEQSQRPAPPPLSPQPQAQPVPLPPQQAQPEPRPQPQEQARPQLEEPPPRRPLRPAQPPLLHQPQ